MTKNLDGINFQTTTTHPNHYCSVLFSSKQGIMTTSWFLWIPGGVLLRYIVPVYEVSRYYDFGTHKNIIFFPAIGSIGVGLYLRHSGFFTSLSLFFLYFLVFSSLLLMSFIGIYLLLVEQFLFLTQ